ncbi:hypothetical protein SAMN04489867_3741 [Pedococcus dokdonensis]|uniref:Uncharacterized protein n=1 Tax=Pedococcus dokdonensis TaxID=443156 RepID=A0A1H0V9C3_9MICO|nr:hypothetical protein SAMN04489867_3741 [Pedococcus dokdonensis]
MAKTALVNKANKKPKFKARLTRAASAAADRHSVFRHVSSP